MNAAHNRKLNFYSHLDAFAECQLISY